ncbi:hypothetical protein F5Y15DRAFT_391426 [Xylariaceae sp. FL0016]|nr:hypothetical protein F5Y15DRAFT_391426 [Xylariaceae sp. FL0016]
MDSFQQQNSLGPRQSSNEQNDSHVNSTDENPNTTFRHPGHTSLERCKKPSAAISRKVAHRPRLCKEYWYFPLPTDTTTSTTQTQDKKRKMDDTETHAPAAKRACHDDKPTAAAFHDGNRGLSPASPTKWKLEPGEDVDEAVLQLASEREASHSLDSTEPNIPQQRAAGTLRVHDSAYPQQPDVSAWSYVPAVRLREYSRSAGPLRVQHLGSLRRGPSP